ncbi:hypothetical protein Taro_008157 [Colocasia esculenta]|uniref:Metal-nicotianamine transporter YSL7 n=1 Tax=Colocasia esculenta TaxID=4460 RepID=A0A843U2I3_COLES|nr:hypothetical protein [Colocasia esculenta]
MDHPERDPGRPKPRTGEEVDIERGDDHLGRDAFDVDGSMVTRGQEGDDRLQLPKHAEKEDALEEPAVPSWREQLTARAFAVSLVIGFFLSFVVMKLSLTTGIIPSLNVSAGLLGFFLIRSWTALLARVGLLQTPFTPQENTVVQTCVVATTGIAFSGGFGSYLLAMSRRVADSMGGGTAAAIDVKELSLGWMVGFLLLVSFVGLFSLVTLRKTMIVKFRLRYPSGTATAHLINSFHTSGGARKAGKQVAYLFKSFVGSFAWSFFQWFYTGGDDCGFGAFPTFGLQAYRQKFYFDFSATYVGVGMICPYNINLSSLLGSIISWGILWPYIQSKKGSWYSAELPASNLHGFAGYKVFISIAVILGDGLFQFFRVLLTSLIDINRRWKADRDFLKEEEEERSDHVLPSAATTAMSSNGRGATAVEALRRGRRGEAHDHAVGDPEEARRVKFFLKDQIPQWLSISMYVGLAAISCIGVPFIFPTLRWYHILVTYFIAPVLAFCNAYGCGLTDWSLASSYGKLAIFVFGMWVGVNGGGVLAGLAACGVMMNIVSTASDLMQDFRTGYLTLASPRSMFFSQIAGTAMGCVIGPCVFWIFYKSFPVGVEGSAYPAPYAQVYRGIALVGVQGFSTLPKNCLSLCLAFFLGAMAFNGLKMAVEHTKKGWHKYLPNVMAMAIPFYLGSYFTIDMCLGSLILFLWERRHRAHADKFAPAVASGMICGDGIWSLPAALLAMAKVQPPICMKFLSMAANAKVDAFLTG